MERFQLGQIVITSNALDFCIENNINYISLLVRHSHCDWGDLDTEDLQENELSLREGFRLFSSYNLPNDLGKLWIITESTREATTVLLPSDY